MKVVCYQDLELIHLTLRINDAEWEQRMFGVVNVLTRRSPRSLTGREEDDIPIIPLANSNNDRQYINVYESRKNQHMLELQDKAEKERRRQEEPKVLKRWNAPRDTRSLPKNRQPSFAKNQGDDEYADSHFDHDDGNKRRFYHRAPPSRETRNQPGTLLAIFKLILISNFNKNQFF